MRNVIRRLLNVDRRIGYSVRRIAQTVERINWSGRQRRILEENVFTWNRQREAIGARLASLIYLS